MKNVLRLLLRATEAALLASGVSLGCAVCPCQMAGVEAPAGQGGGGAAPVAAAGGAAVAAGGGSTQSVPYAWKNVAILGGGFVSGIVFSPLEKGLVYARTDVGGAYRWNGADQSWVPLTDEFGRDSSFTGIESIAADPVDANRVYAAVGTYVKSWVGNGAILRSSDRGNTWTITNMPIQMGGNEYGRSNGERLAVDPNEPNILYFGSRAKGLWKSTDAGATWNSVSFPAKQDPENIGIVFVVFDKPSGSKGKPTPVLYAGVARTDGTLYSSTDGGGSWKLVPKQPMGLMASHAAFDNRRTMYVSYGSGPGPNDEVDGAVWKYEPEQNVFTNITPAAPDKAGDKFGYGGLSVDAAHPGTVMVTTIDRWTKGDEIYRTIDGGKSWKPIGQNGLRDDAGAKYLYWDHDKASGNGWMGDIDIDPFDPAHVLYVTGQGVWGSDDANAADTGKPTHWSFRDRGLEETVVAELLSPPSGPPLLSVVGDLGGFRHDDLNVSPAAGMFHNPIFGSGSGIDCAWSKPEIVVRVGYADQGKNGAYSIDGGAKWTPFASMPAGKGAGATAVSADGTTFLWAPKEGPTVYSRDRGATWPRAEGLPDPAKIPDWAPVNIKIAADRVNPNKFYVYNVLSGRAYTSTDGGAHFVASPGGMPTLPDYNLGSGSAHAVPGIEGDVWLTTGKELYHSTDSGKTFRTVGTVAVSIALGFGKAADGKKYPAMYLVGKVNDTAGFFRSDDGAATWVRINDDRHQFGFVGAITGDPRVYGRAYVGTGGRGIVYGDPK
jgi:xyloglucan-specific exo-beta-1,4-glucanase